MRTDLWTLMRGGVGGGGGGGGGNGQAQGGDSGRTKHRPRRPPPPPPPDPVGQFSADFSDAPSSAPSSPTRESLHLRTDSIAFTPSQPSAADRRSQSSIALPRRSILAPETKDEDEEDDRSADEVKPQRTRSRILGELRPVASPREAAEISTPIRAPPPSPPRLLLPDEDEIRELEDATGAASGVHYQAYDAALGSPSSAQRRAFDVFASRCVRLQRRWGSDLWVFMKNAHPALAPLTAHKWHPFRRLDRVLVLLVALAATLVVSGIVSTRPCCSTTSASPTPSVATPTASIPALALAVSTATAASTCTCGLAHTSGLVAVAIAAVVPLVILLLEPLVTLYHDAKLFGCAVRVRRGRSSGGCCAYRPDGLAARAGRAFVLLLLVALAFAAGVVAARAWDEDAAVDLDAVLVEWVVVFAAAAALGLVGYCSVVWLGMFVVRWWKEGREAKSEGNASEVRHQWAGVTAEGHEASPV